MLAVTVGSVMLARGSPSAVQDARDADHLAKKAHIAAEENKQSIKDLEGQLLAINEASMDSTSRLNKAIEDVLQAEGEAAIVAGRKRLQAMQAEQAAIAKRKADLEVAIRKKKRTEKLDMTKCIQGGSLGSKDCL